MRAEVIERAIDIVVAQFAPEQVFLIGSYATRTAKRTSDLDLVIVADSTEPKHLRDQRVEHVLAPLLIPVDANVYTPAEFQAELRQLHGFARMATQLQGKLMYSRVLGDFDTLHRRWESESGGVRHRRLQSTPGEWQLYQARYSRLARAWREPAWAFAAARAGGMTGARVADLGCGEGAFANAIGRDVAAFDHVAEPSRSIAADLAALPLADASIDLAVLSLSLVGTKWADSLTEAARVVAPGGHVVVTELANGPRSPEAIAAVLAGCGWTGLRFLDRDPFIDIEAQRAE